jgi:hypothetical protein
MKAIKTRAASTLNFRSVIIYAGLMMLLFIPVSMFAQADSTQKEAPAAEPAAAEEESSLIGPSLDFITVQKANNTIDLKAAMQAKVKGTFYKLSLLKVSFVLVTETGDIPLGFVITDKYGKAVLNVKADSLKANAEGKLNFKAVFAGNKAMDPAEGEVSIKRARLEITPVKEDSLLTVQVKLIDLGTGAETPVPETALGIFVARLINPLKVGEGTTDADGAASVEIPNNLPGDAKGNITLIARLDENEVYGNLESSVVQPWGLKVSDKLKELPRALWSPHPPLWMVITFTILMVAVWGHYIVIIVQLFRLRKEEPHTAIATKN